MKSKTILLLWVSAILWGFQASQTEAVTIQGDGSVMIDEANFPDEKIRYEIRLQLDHNQDKVLSNEEIRDALSLKIFAAEVSVKNPQGEVLDLKGLELFENLEEVELSLGPGITSVRGDLKGNKQLRKVSFYEGRGGITWQETETIFPMAQLKEITILGEFPEISLRQGTNLQEITIEDCRKLKTLDVSGNKNLDRLYIKNTGLTELDLSQNTKLQKLELRDMGIKSLELSKNRKLKDICLAGLQLQQVNIKWLSDLKKLMIQNVPLKQLSLSKNRKIRELILEDVPLKTLDVCQAKELDTLEIYRCGMKKLKLSSNRRLKNFLIDNTKISRLDLSKNTKLKEVTIRSGEAYTWVNSWTKEEYVTGFHYANSNVSCKLTLPKKNNIQELTFFMKNKQLDISHCTKIKELNISKKTKIITRKSWFQKNSKKVKIYVEGVLQKKMKQKNARRGKYVRLSATKKKERLGVLYPYAEAQNLLLD